VPVEPVPVEPVPVEPGSVVPVSVGGVLVGGMFVDDVSVDEVSADGVSVAPVSAETGSVDCVFVDPISVEAPSVDGVPADAASVEPAEIVASVVADASGGDAVPAVGATGASAGAGATSEVALVAAVEAAVAASSARIGSPVCWGTTSVAPVESGSAEELCAVVGSYGVGDDESVVGADCAATLAVSGAKPVGSCPTLAVTADGLAVAGADAVVDGCGGLDVAPTLFVSTVAGLPPAQFRRVAIAPVRNTDRAGP
jgi:hypothetical protein